MVRYKFDEIAINSTEKKKPVEEDKYTYLGLDHLDSGTLKISRFGADVAPIGEKLIIRKGDVLFGKRRAYQKKVAIAPFDGIFSAHGMVLRPRTDVISTKLFPFFVSSNHFLDKAIKISVGSLSPTINWRDLKDLEFNIPPIEKQDVLADQLWAMEETKEAYNQLLIATDALVKSQFIEMFGSLGADEKGWGLSRLGDYCEINPRKSDDSRISNAPDVSFIAMPSVTENGEIDTLIIRPYIDVKSGFTYFAENDVLLAKITPCMENGKGAIARGLHNGIGFGSTEFHVLRPNPAKCIPEWIYAITVFPQFRKDAEIRMTGTGGQKRVPVSFLSNYLVSLPPIELQKKYASFVNQTDKSKFALLQNIDKLEQCRNALIQKSFG